ncbi:FadR/GntR family transcriptional regulator [Microbacterium sp. YY-01]|uniref:FadR/GntR family transcriptional regulator n=1 Tax=Microbacterium sp. YY-01 TaxID=3421634 RepID=UPI003D1860F1
MNDSLERMVGQLLELAVPDAASGARRLPPERELCERLGVSRGALREQLAVLETLGFLHRTQGRGTFIGTPDDAFVRSYFAIAQQLGHLEQQQFAQAREVLEESAAAAAALTATPAAVAALRADAQRMIDAAQRDDHEAALDADVSFHRRLQHMVHNPVLHLLHEGLSHVLHDTIRSRRLAAVEVEQPRSDGIRAADQVHHDIVDAIARQNPDAARQAMRQHFALWLALPVVQ